MDSNDAAISKTRLSDKLHRIKALARWRVYRALFLAALVIVVLSYFKFVQQKPLPGSLGVALLVGVAILGICGQRSRVKSIAELRCPDCRTEVFHILEADNRRFARVKLQYCPYCAHKID